MLGAQYLEGRGVSYAVVTGPPLSALPSDSRTYLWTSRDVERRDSRAEDGNGFYDFVREVGTEGDIQVFQVQRGPTVRLEEIPKAAGFALCPPLSFPPYFPLVSVDPVPCLSAANSPAVVYCVFIWDPSV